MKPTRKRLCLLAAAAAAGAGLLLLVVACQPTLSPVEIQPSATQTQTAPTDTPSPAAPAATATQPEPSREEATPAPVLPLEDPTPMPAGTAGTSVAIPPTAKAAVAVAKADLAQKLGVSQEDILVTSIEAVQWSDSSLGCPRPGMMYMQVITPGFRVILQAQGQAYEYHTDQGRNAVPCDGKTPVSQAPLPVIVEPGLEGLVDQAKKDLAQRLSVDMEQIELLAAESVVWPDSSLGCPEPGMAYLQVLQDGMLILLSVGGQAYEYHSGGSRGPFLCEQPL